MITIDREGARRLDIMLQTDAAEAQMVTDAIRDAAAGDFGPLRALLGEREGAGEAPDFRLHDVVTRTSRPDSGEWIVNGIPERMEGGASWLVPLARIDGGSVAGWYASDLTLLRRREWRVGECPPPAAGQDRVCNALGLFPYTVVDNQGGRVAPWRVRWEDGRLTEMRAKRVAADALRADWTAPEAVDVKL